jgi:teichuronic acid biosynthesis glycosyltransferase TuaH
MAQRLPRADGCGGMSVAIVASVPYEGHRLYEQRIATALAIHTRIAYLEPPTAPRSVAAVRRGAVVRDAGQTLVQPAWTLPFTRRLRLDRLREVAAARAAVRASSHFHEPTSAVVYNSLSGALRAFPEARHVLLVKDDYVAGADLLGEEPNRIEDELRCAVEIADSVVAVSPVLRTRLRRFGVEAEIIPAGCNILAPAHGHTSAGRRPRAAFIGGISPRISPAHLLAVLDAGCDLVILGGFAREFPSASQRATIDKLLVHPRVDWRGHVEAPEVADVLADVDVGLVPYDASPFNLASFPLKTLEYLGAGVPVVSTPLPAIEWIGSDQIRVEDEAAAFGAAAAAVGRSVTPDVRQACRDDAAEHTWDRRAEQWLSVLGLGSAGAPVEGP